MGLQIGSYKHWVFACGLLEWIWSPNCFLPLSPSSASWGLEAPPMEIKSEAPLNQPTSCTDLEELWSDTVLFVFFFIRFHWNIFLFLKMRLQGAHASRLTIPGHSCCLCPPTAETGELAHQHSDTHWLVTKDQNDQNQSNLKPLSSALHLTLKCLPCIFEHFWNSRLLWTCQTYQNRRKNYRNANMLLMLGNVNSALSLPFVAFALGARDLVLFPDLGRLFGVWSGEN